MQHWVFFFFACDFLKLIDPAFYTELLKLCEYSRSRLFGLMSLFKDQISGERSQGRFITSGFISHASLFLNFSS